MNKDKIAWIIGSLIGIIVAFVISTFVGLWLWRVIAVAIFKLPILNFWQFVGLELLCGILFKPTKIQNFSEKDKS